MFSGSIEGVGPVQVQRLHLADVTLPQGTPLAGQTCPVHAYLVLHPHGPVLFDSGVSAHPAIDPLYRPVRYALGDALAGLGLRLSQIAAVINCHLHFDHAGGNTLFPGVPIFVQKRELEAARGPAYTTPDCVDFPGADLRPLDGEAEVLPGLRIVQTPGHTAGHQSLVIEAEEARVVIAGQAAYTAEEFAQPEPGHVWGRPAAGDPVRYLESLQRLHSLSPRLVCFSHDDAVWRAPAPAR